MPDFKTSVVATLFATLLATTAFAQDNTAAPEDTDQPAETAEGQAGGESPENTLGLSMGQAQGNSDVGQTYTKEEHGDWDVRCVHTGTEQDPCQLYQLLQDSDGNNVAEISMFPLPAGGQAVAGATIITPLETLLTAQIEMRIDNSAVKRYPFSWCASMGCFSRIGFTAEEVVQFRRGAKAVMSIRPVAAPDETVDLEISLAGFTAGYEAVASANADALKQAE